MELYREVEKEIERVDELVSRLKAKRKELREKFKQVHYCPLCGSGGVVEAPVLPIGGGKYFYCKNCDKAFRAGLATLRKKKKIKESLKADTS